MDMNKKAFYSLVSLLVVFLLVSGPFSGSQSNVLSRVDRPVETPPDVEEKRDVSASLADLKSEMSLFIADMESMGVAYYELIKGLTDGFNKTVGYYGDDLSAEDIERFNQLMIEYMPTFIEAYYRGVVLMEKWNDVYSTYSDTASSRFLLTLGALAVGMVCMGYAGYKAVDSAVEKNAGTAKTIINDANPTDLAKINEELGLDPSTPKEDTIKYMDGLGMNAKNIAAKKVQALDMQAELSTDHYSEIKQTHAEIAKDVGTEGVKIYAGAITTVTGGQGIDKIAQAAGLSETGAVLVDTAVTVTSNQPLDHLGSSIESDMAMVSKDKRSVTLDTPDTKMDTGTAKATLEKMKTAAEKAKSGASVEEVNTADAPADDGKNAVDSTMNNIAEDHSTELQKDKDYYTGEPTVQVPDKVFVDTDTEVATEGETTVKVPEFGKSDMLIAPEDGAPDVVPDVDPGEEEAIEFEYVDLSSIGIVTGPPIDVVFCIDLTGSMADDIKNVVDSATSMLDEVMMMTDNFRFGIVGYRDLEYDSPAFERFAFSSDPGVILANIYALPDMVHGGGDVPESMYEAMYIAYNMPWREGVDHTVIVMADAPAKTSYGGTRASPSYDNVTVEEVAELRNMTFTDETIVESMNEKEISVYPILVGNSGTFSAETRETFEILANGTGGKMYEAKDASIVPEVMKAALETAVTEAEEDDKDGESNATGLSIGAMFLFCGLPILVVILIIVAIVALVKRAGRKNTSQQQAYQAPYPQQQQQYQPPPPQQQHPPSPPPSTPPPPPPAPTAPAPAMDEKADDTPKEDSAEAEGNSVDEMWE